MNNSSSSSSSSVEPSLAVHHMHKAPRFGHSNNIALLASRNHDEQYDYARGIFGFCMFLWCWFLLWMIVLLVLKYYCGVARVGCAARGDVVDVQALKKQGMRKVQRKRRIVRSWRTQSTLLLTCVLFLMTMVCWNKLGVLPMVNLILPSLQQINQSIQGLAFQGLQIANSIQRASAPLIHNRQNLTALLDSHHHSQNCPLSNQLLPWSLYQRTIQVGLDDLTTFVNTTVSSASTGWSQVIGATRTMESILYHATQHVYVVRAWMVVTGVLNLFLLAGVALTLHYVIHEPLSCFLAYLILPLFILCMLAALAGLGGLSALVTMNADFCAGGPSPGSAVGTMLDMMYRRGMQQNGFVYDTLIYYLNDCVTTSPFASTSTTVQGMGHTLDIIASWQQSVTNSTLSTFSKACQKDITQTMAQLDVLAINLQSVQSNLQSALGLAQCQNIYPILQEISHGSLCTTSVNALTWMWSTTLVMLVLAFIIISCRAGLFNAIVRAPPKHGQLRYQQKEFDEYKKFMAQHYDEAAKWKFEPDKKEGHDEELQPVATFETEATTKLSTVRSSSSSSSEHGGIPPMVTVVNCHADVETVSQSLDVPIEESFELNATMVAEIEDLGKGLDRLGKDLEDLEESMDRAYIRAAPNQDDDSPLFQTPMRLLSNQHALNLSMSSYSSLWSWKSRVHPNNSLLVEDTELKPLTPPPTNSAPMAPRKMRQSLPRTRNSGLV